MNNKTIICWFIATAFAGIILLLLIQKNVSPYGSSDSAAYIEAAHNLKVGRGLTVSTFGVYPVDRDIAPLALWPPGYPLLIALVSSFNIDEETAAVIIPKIFFLLLPFAFFLVLRFLIRDTLALASAVIITFMWPTVALSMLALSDILFLFISLISFYLLFKSLADQRIRYSFMAGISVAFAVMTRHIGYDLVLGTITGLLLALWMRTIAREKYFRIQTTYFLGFAIGYLPLLLRNIFTLHTLQPFRMPIESTTLFYPVIKYLKELACVLLGIWPLHVIYLIGLILLLLLTAYYLKRGRIIEYCRANPLKTTYFFILLSYFLLAVLLFTVIGPLYLWKGNIEFRLLIPHYWIIVIFFILALTFWCERLEHFFKIKQKLSIVVLLIIFFLAQFSALQIWINRQRPQLDAFVNLENATGLINVIKALPKNTYVISNCGSYLRLLTGRNVRKLSRFDTDLSPQTLADLVCRTRTLYVILIYQPLISEILPESWLSINGKTIPKGYQCLSNNDRIIILRHDKQF